MKKYRLKSRKCVNSEWEASWLLTKDQEGCQCDFGCKVIVEHTSGYPFIVTEDEFRLINIENPIEEKSDEERLVEWLKKSFQGYAMNFPASNWFLDTAKQFLAAGLRVEDLK